MDFEQQYLDACEKPSDINEHLPTLARLASECSHVTEMGVRNGVSTRALLRNPVVYVGYDIDEGGMTPFFNNARDAGRNITFIVDNSTRVNIEETDMLFIDTKHNYDQLRVELMMHGNKVRKYLAFHDTTLFGTSDEFGSGPGLWKAIEEFLQENPHWKVVEKYENNNGLTVLGRSN